MSSILLNVILIQVVSYFKLCMSMDYLAAASDDARLWMYRRHNGNEHSVHYKLYIVNVLYYMYLEANHSLTYARIFLLHVEMY